jgi:act minimal PKS chain-length factor (CLF/KS beta)
MTRTVVTGLAALAANGADTESYWRATLNGTSGLGLISHFDPAGYPVRVAGEVSLFTSTDHVERRIVVQTDRWTQLALTASDRALADAGIVPEEQPEHSMSVVTSASSGGNAFGQVEIQNLWSKGPRHVGPYQSIAWFYAATTGQVSIRHGMKGPCGVLVAEQAGGLDAIGHARRMVRDEGAVVVTGGTEAPIGPYALTCQTASGLLHEGGDPARAYLPFDPEADGYVPGEGGAILIVEPYETAVARGARLYGEVAGYAATFDPGGRARPALLRAVTMALADAQVEAGEVDVVFADAQAVPAADAVEIDVLAGLFGPGGVPVTAPKSLVGRVYAGGPPLDAATALLAIRDGVIPPTGGTRPTQDLPLDLVTTAREARVRVALILARGFGGFTSALVVRAV